MQKFCLYNAQGVTALSRGPTSLATIGVASPPISLLCGNYRFIAGYCIRCSYRWYYVFIGK